MKRILILFLSCLVLLSGCGDGGKEVKITSFDIVSIVPVGLTALEALVAVGVDNPRMGFEIADVKGTLKMRGTPCIVLTADRVVIDARCAKTYKIPFSGQLADGFNPFMLLNFFKDKDVSAFTLDLKLEIALRGGVGKVLEYRDLSVDMLTKKL